METWRASFILPVGLAFTPFLISSLGEIEYGLYQLLYATIGYIALLDFGLGGTLTRFILKYQADGDQERVNSVTIMGVKIYSAIAVFAMLLTVAASLFLNKLYPASISAENLAYAQRMFIIMGATTSISLISHAMQGIETAYEQYPEENGTTSI